MHPADFSSPAVQAIVTTEKIYHLARLFKKTKSRNKQMLSAIQKYLFQRRKLMNNLRRSDFNRFMFIVQEYKLAEDPREITHTSHFTDIPRHGKTNNKKGYGHHRFRYGWNRKHY